MSHHNGVPDWTQVKADGVRFAVAKATEGQTFVDGEYATNRAQATAVSLPFTAYHYAQPDTTANDAVLEADHFVDTAQLGRNHLLPVLDLEVNNGLRPKSSRPGPGHRLARVQQRLGVKAIIYTGPSFWATKMGEFTVVRGQRVPPLDSSLWRVTAHCAGPQLGRPRLDPVAVHQPGHSRWR